MFKTTVTYKDFNDKSHTEDLYFHMLTPELADLQFNPVVNGDFATYIKQALKDGEGQKVYSFFKLMIVNSYGRRSEDGSQFVKKPEWTEQFLNSRAYEEFFMWLVENPKNAEKFWMGIMPERMLDKVSELEGNSKKKLSELSKEEIVKLYQQAIDAKAVEA